MVMTWLIKCSQLSKLQRQRGELKESSSKQQKENRKRGYKNKKTKKINKNKCNVKEIEASMDLRWVGMAWIHLPKEKTDNLDF